MRLLFTFFALIILTQSCVNHTERLDHFEVHGIDVSHYQSYIDWSKLPGNKIDFAFVKATEGAFMVDTLYCHNWEEATKVGIRRGAYHFFRPTIPIQFQIHNFITTVEMEEGDLPPVLDVEVLDGTPPESIRRDIKTWMAAIESHYRIKPILYTNLNYYHRFLAGYFIDYPIWIARYNYQEPFLDLGKNWHFWQYGNRGLLDGIEGFVDFNVFNGTLADLDNMCLVYTPTLSLNEHQTADFPAFVKQILNPR